jgi:hypothetical protein
MERIGLGDRATVEAPDRGHLTRLAVGDRTSSQPHAAENRGDGPVRGVDVFAPPRPDPDRAE